MAVFSRLLPTIVSAYAFQTLAALIFVPQKQEMYYDLCGSFGFMSTTFLSLYYPALKTKYWDGFNIALPTVSSFAPRQLVLTAAIGIWSARLGYFLSTRALKSGGDSRFDEVKHKPATFFAFWMAQATWVFVVGLPVYLCNTLPPALHPALALRDYAALGLIAGSFAFEVIADYQKSAWRKAKNAKQHDEKFITSGLWSLSRHPNYIGEVGIWTGMWALSTSALQTAYFPRGAIAFAAMSPVLTYFLLRNVGSFRPS
ncbi:DUF1295-domain-containing protein [Mucidula mucida]|nr:DUF1295-domain-containing protein [Mucidula mucida]